MNSRYAVLLSALAMLASYSLWAAAAPPNDPQIAAIVVTANQVDIDAGKLAQSKTHSKEVKDFAGRMVTDHTGVNTSATALGRRQNVRFGHSSCRREVELCNTNGRHVPIRLFIAPEHEGEIDRKD